MRKESIRKIEEEINKKTTLPNELKENIRKEVFTNIIIAISMIVYFTFLIMGSVGTTKTVRTIDFNIFSIVLLGLTIYLFEIAYKKDSGKLAIYGIETLLVATITLFLPYIIFELDEFHKKYYMIISAYIGIYYVIKSICIVNKSKKKYIKQASDIKEIVKKEKKKSKRIDKEEIEEIRNDIKINEDKKIEEPKKIDNKTAKEDKKAEKKTENMPKRRGRPAKKKTTDEIKNNVPKKRGRPKKEEALAKEDNKKEDEVKEDTPRKRGRPRKVVTSND